MANTNTGLPFKSTVFVWAYALPFMAAAFVLPALVATGVIKAGDENTRTLYYIAAIGSVMAMSYLASNLGRIDVTFDGRVIGVGYGRFKQAIPLSNVRAVEVRDRASYDAAAASRPAGGKLVRCVSGNYALVTITTPTATYVASCQNADEFVKLVKEKKGGGTW
jgi:hypothetical protein